MHHTDRILPNDIDLLLDAKADPCISMYLPTHPITLHAEKDRIRLKNLRAEAFGKLLERDIRRPDAESILLPVDQLLEDEAFWPYLSDGLAIFCSPGPHAVFRLPISPSPTLRVEDRFILKPLLPLLSESEIFYIMAISRNAVRLFEGTPHHVSEIHINELPANMSEALRLGGREPNRAPQRLWQGSEGEKALYRNYFLYIDRVLRPFYGDSSSPLVVAAVDYLLPIFREASTYRSIVPLGITGNPDKLSAEELHTQAWPIVEPLFSGRRRDALEEYQALQGSGRTTQEIQTIMSAALDGRVKTLFFSLSAEVFGSFDAATRTLEVRPDPLAGDTDLCAQAARWVYRTGGVLFGGEPPHIPAGGPMTAIFRYL
jgi:hypothetical protein